ncbi:hypothetical protein SPRG_16388 [Saprolegnia parasitica CBS 223.65]|uniref:Uncharacterized protein n=1 Tax=Saprolegnia parasitica (strain CBS 223.65) TaxID=695850 RepID=A0A067BVB6_SAPPC|nr:hypothetical protein SPRG_16388 [Saprolegnia parasitica CBS 223.65]KDO18216.1 hypothetical protein SPRG_16388 [Saprolegnia parasitica CBS 223.65]|eukprot:XP_012211077.1 hypothetical protein SPRG_16388 [Saprolegnia parasitica CBS 223.65]
MGPLAAAYHLRQVEREQAWRDQYEREASIAAYVESQQRAAYVEQQRATCVEQQQAQLDQHQMVQEQASREQQCQQHLYSHEAAMAMSVQARDAQLAGMVQKLQQMRQDLATALKENEERMLRRAARKARKATAATTKPSCVELMLHGKPETAVYVPEVQVQYVQAHDQQAQCAALVEETQRQDCQLSISVGKHVQPEQQHCAAAGAQDEGKTGTTTVENKATTVNAFKDNAPTRALECLEASARPDEEAAVMETVCATTSGPEAAHESKGLMKDADHEIKVGEKMLGKKTTKRCGEASHRGSTVGKESGQRKCQANPDSTCYELRPVKQARGGGDAIPSPATVAMSKAASEAVKKAVRKVRWLDEESPQVAAADSVLVERVENGKQHVNRAVTAEVSQESDILGRGLAQTTVSTVSEGFMCNLGVVVEERGDDVAAACGGPSRGHQLVDSVDVDCNGGSTRQRSQREDVRMTKHDLRSGVTATASGSEDADMPSRGRPATECAVPPERDKGWSTEDALSKVAESSSQTKDGGAWSVRQSSTETIKQCGLQDVVCKKRTLWDESPSSATDVRLDLTRVEILEVHECYGGGPIGKPPWEKPTEPTNEAPVAQARPDLEPLPQPIQLLGVVSRQFEEFSRLFSGDQLEDDRHVQVASTTRGLPVDMINDMTVSPSESNCKWQGLVSITVKARMIEQPDATADQAMVGSKELADKAMDTDGRRQCPQWLYTQTAMDAHQSLPMVVGECLEQQSWQDVKADVGSIDEKLEVPNDDGIIYNSHMAQPRGFFQATEEDDTSLCVCLNDQGISGDITTTGEVCQCVPGERDREQVCYLTAMEAVTRTMRFRYKSLNVLGAKTRTPGWCPLWCDDKASSTSNVPSESIGNRLALPTSCAIVDTTTEQSVQMEPLSLSAKGNDEVSLSVKAAFKSTNAGCVSEGAGHCGCVKDMSQKLPTELGDNKRNKERDRLQASADKKRAARGDEALVGKAAQHYATMSQIQWRGLQLTLVVSDDAIVRAHDKGSVATSAHDASRVESLPTENLIVPQAMIDHVTSNQGGLQVTAIIHGDDARGKTQKMQWDNWRVLKPAVQHVLNYAPRARLGGKAPATVMTEPLPSKVLDAPLHDGRIEVSQQLEEWKKPKLFDDQARAQGELHRTTKVVGDMRRAVERNAKANVKGIRLTIGDYWLGPGRVVEALPDDIFKVEEPFDGSESIHHISRLEMFAAKVVNVTQVPEGHTAYVEGGHLVDEPDGRKFSCGLWSLRVKWRGSDKLENARKPAAKLLKDEVRMVEDCLKANVSKAAAGKRKEAFEEGAMRAPGKTMGEVMCTDRIDQGRKTTSERHELPTKITSLNRLGRQRIAIRDPRDKVPARPLVLGEEPEKPTKSGLLGLLLNVVQVQLSDMRRLDDNRLADNALGLHLYSTPTTACKVQQAVISDPCFAPTSGSTTPGESGTIASSALTSLAAWSMPHMSLMKGRSTRK